MKESYIKYESERYGFEVKEGQWLQSGKDVLYTTGASTCVVVALFNPVRSIGFLGHFKILDSDNSKNFDSMIEAALKAYGDMGNADVWVGGTTLTGLTEYNGIFMHEKESYKHRLHGSGIRAANIEEHWLDIREEISYLSLDCRDGAIDFAVDPIPPHDA